VIVPQEEKRSAKTQRWRRTWEQRKPLLLNANTNVKKVNDFSGVAFSKPMF